MRAPGPIVGLASTAALLLVACGQAKLDTERAESAIRAQITRQTGVKIESLRCPDEIEARQGETFRCVAVASSGERSTVEVTQRDDEGGLSWRLVPPR